MATALMQKLRAPVTGRNVPICSLYHTHSFSVHVPSGAGSNGLCSFTQATTAAAAAAARGILTSTAAASQRKSYFDAGVTHDVLPAAAYGQVISAEANFVRVNISHLETDPSATSSSSSSSNGTSSTSSNGTSASSNNSPADATQPAPPVKQLLCTVRALLKKIGQRVLVGDHVRVNPIDWTDGRGVVDSIQPRSSELADPAVANVDHVLLLFGLTQPPFEPAQVSRFLVSLGASGLPVTLALNKADLLPAQEIQARIDQVAEWGYAAVAVSCETGLGLEELAQRLAGKVSVVAGPSGAGKSSLINALRLGRHKPDAQAAAGAAAGGMGLQDVAAGVQWQYSRQQQQQQQEDVGYPGSSSSSSSCCSDSDDEQQPSSSSSSSFLAVGDVSRIGRGRHTTRTVTLIELPFGGLMADTPGFNQPTLDRVSSAELAGLFPEFVAAQEAVGGCRFADCMHLAEPGCAVTAAELERHEHYVKFLAEVKAREDFDVRVMQLTKQRREGAMKAKTGRGGETRYEARLNSKKHRSTSRRKLKQNVWGDVSDDEFREDMQE